MFLQLPSLNFYKYPIVSLPKVLGEIVFKLIFFFWWPTLLYTYFLGGFGMEKVEKLPGKLPVRSFKEREPMKGRVILITAEALEK